MKNYFILAIFMLAATQINAQNCGCTQTPIQWFGGTINCNLDAPYKLVFYDEFNGATLDLTKWYTFYPYGPNSSDQCEFCRTHGNENQIYRDANVIVSDGTVKLRALEENGTWMTATRPYSSGMIQSKQNFKFGKFEIRCKMPPGEGFWPAFWLFGGDECDVFEYCSDAPSDQIMTLHTNCNGTHCQTAVTESGVNSSDGFHTYSVEWEGWYVVWKTDGVVVRRVNRLTTMAGNIVNCGDDLAIGTYMYNNFIPDDFMNVIANLAVNAQGGGCGNTVPNDETPFPADLEIDYIRVWQKTPQQGLTDLCAERHIEGSNSICSGQQVTYTFVGPLANGLTWTVSSNLVIVSQTATTVTVRPLNNSSSGAGWIKAQTNANELCPQTQFTKDVVIGKPVVDMYVDLDCVFTELEALVQPANLTGTWQITTSRPYTISGNTVNIRGARYFPSSFSYTYSVSNSCGTTTKSGYGTIPSCYAAPQLMVTPNPANQNLSIRIEGEVNREDIDYLSFTSQYSGAQQILDWNNQDINLNVSGYATGLYLVSLKFKDSNDILTQQVVIQR